MIRSRSWWETARVLLNRASISSTHFKGKEMTACSSQCLRAHLRTDRASKLEVKTRRGSWRTMMSLPKTRRMSIKIRLLTLVRFKEPNQVSVLRIPRQTPGSQQDLQLTHKYPPLIIRKIRNHFTWFLAYHQEIAHWIHSVRPVKNN